MSQVSPNKFIEVVEPTAANLFTLLGVDPADELIPGVITRALEEALTEMIDNSSMLKLMDSRFIPEYFLTRVVYHLSKLQHVLDDSPNYNVFALLVIHPVFVPSVQVEYLIKSIYLQSIKTRLRIPFSNFSKDTSDLYLVKSMEMLDKLIKFIS